MKVPIKGAVDCDLHPAPPSAEALLPYLDEYWRDQLVDRHIARYSFNLTSYPPNSPLSARPDWRQKSGLPGGDLEMIRRQALVSVRLTLCDLQRVAWAPSRCSTKTWRWRCAPPSTTGSRRSCSTASRGFRASILVPVHNPERAVAEIERVGEGSAFRPGAAVRHGRHAARTPAVLADLCGGP